MILKKENVLAAEIFKILQWPYSAVRNIYLHTMVQLDPNAPAHRSLRRAWDNGRATGGGETLSFFEWGRDREKERAWYSERKRLWEWVSWSLDGGEDGGTMLGIYARLMGPNSAEYTEGQQGSTLTFLFTQSAALCVRTVTDWQPVRGGSLPFAQCMLGKSPASLNWRRE